MRHYVPVAGEVPSSARGRGNPQDEAPSAAQPFTHLGVRNAEQYRYHGDFDWGGVRIANAVRQRAAQARSHWRPWRYDRDAYEALATVRPAVRHTATKRSRLTGEPAATPWDPGLAAAMARHGVRAEEELSLDLLLADLAELIPGPLLSPSPGSSLP